MLNKVKLTEKEMRVFAEAFAYYDYGSEEIGMGEKVHMYDLVKEAV